MHPAQISFIVQGPIYFAGNNKHSTADCLGSIRRHFPGAEIILSTWEGSNVSGLDYDQLVMSADPGGEKDVDGRPFNLNRQILSTISGLRKASRQYAAKIRSDTKMVSASLLDFFGVYAAKMRGLQLFNHRILLPKYYSHSPAHKRARILFHPSDMFHFGNIQDLLDLWDIPLQKFTAQTWGECPYVPEQYIWLAFLRKRGVKDARLSRYYEFSPRLLWLSEKSLAANFVILSSEQLGISMSVPSHGDFIEETCYTHQEWLGIYHSYQTLPKAVGRMTSLLWLRRDKFIPWLQMHADHFYQRAIAKLCQQGMVQLQVGRRIMKRLMTMSH